MDGMSPTNEFDVAIIGGGPGGYTAAEAAAHAGLRTVLFERDELGGTCLNRGCIPTKALLHAAEAWRTVNEAAELGISVEGASYDFAAMHARKDAVVAGLREGVAKLMRAGKVAVVPAAAQIVAPGVVEAAGERYAARDIIVATGSIPSVSPISGVDLPGVYTSDDLLEGEAAGKPFNSLAIIGGGVIGVEMAGIYAALGCRVTVLEALDHLLPPMDREIAQRLGVAFKKQGIAVACGARVTGIERGADGLLCVRYENKRGRPCMAEAEGMLVAAGRRANTAGLFAPGCEPELAHGAIVASEDGRTSQPHLWAIGDVRAGTIQLAHVAEAQAKNTVAAILGKPAPVDLRTVPSCVYTSPEVASVGLSEAEAKAAGYTVRCGKSLAGASGKCTIEGCAAGYIKLVAEAQTGVLLGAQLVYPRATDLVGELAVAVQRGMTARELAAVIHPHPTFCEGIRAAAEQLA